MFAQNNETFGFDIGKPWATSVFPILFSVPRLYRPLLDAWDTRYPGTKRALERLEALEMVDHQGPVIMNVRTGSKETRASTPVPRFKATASGKRLAEHAVEDSRVLMDTFPRISERASHRVALLLKAYCLEVPHSRLGISAGHATSLAGMPERSGRWWTRHLQAKGYLAELPRRLPDTRELIPEHWRPNRTLCKQLAKVIEAFPESTPGSLKWLYRLERSRFLSDIELNRIGLTGATDYDHDVETQRILAAFLQSPRCAHSGVFAVEPKMALRVDQGSSPWLFGGPDYVYYQPDAELREWDQNGAVRRGIVEYERFQSRRDAWSHIERFLGWLHETNPAGEPAILRFVVDTESRTKSYVALIEAFADYLIDFPSRRPRASTMLAVSSLPKVTSGGDPLDDRRWYRIALPLAGSETVPRPALHGKKSPYDEYFTREAKS